LHGAPATQGWQRAGSDPPLQNRVTPLGDLVATPARGTLMGNRGRLHDDARRIVRRVVPGYRAWVTCRLEFKGRRRAVMSPGRYTELFFLDEATALAAGHRPCGECRRADYRRFKALWLAANRRRIPGRDVPIAAIDRVLHRDRLGATGQPRTFSARLASLPDGVFVCVSGAREPLLLWRGTLRPWSPAGYGAPRAWPEAGDRVRVLTPRSTVAAIAAGYVPAFHASATQSARARSRSCAASAAKRRSCRSPSSS
jgi:hypothetical protein